MFTARDNRNEQPHTPPSHEDSRIALHDHSRSAPTSPVHFSEKIISDLDRRVQHHYRDHKDDPPPAHLYNKEILGHGRCFTMSRSGLGGAGLSFTIKLHEMLNSAEAENSKEIVSWQPHGRCFVIRNVESFKELLPRFFGIDKLASFQRQLNMYGFQRITQGLDKTGYYHELFLRGRVFLAYQIRRLRIKGKGARAKANPDQEPDFWKMPWLEEIPRLETLATSAVQHSAVASPRKNPQPAHRTLAVENEDTKSKSSRDSNLDSISQAGTLSTGDGQESIQEAHGQFSPPEAARLRPLSHEREWMLCLPPLPSTRGDLRDMREEPQPRHKWNSSAVSSSRTDSDNTVNCWGKQYYPVHLDEDSCDVSVPPRQGPPAWMRTRSISTTLLPSRFRDMRMPLTANERSVSCPPRMVGQKCMPVPYESTFGWSQSNWQTETQRILPTARHETEEMECQRTVASEPYTQSFPTDNQKEDIEDPSSFGGNNALRYGRWG